MKEQNNSFNPNDWVDNSNTFNNNHPIIDHAKDNIAKAINGEKHYVLCKAAFLLGGYVGGGEIAEMEARNGLRDAISNKSGVKNLNSAFMTIDKCLEAGKRKPLTGQLSSKRTKAYLQDFDYSKFSEQSIEGQTEKLENLPSFPVEVFPKFIQDLIIKANETVRFPVNYLGASILFTVSAIIGNAFKVSVRHTQQETGLLYMAIVGAPGVNKSHPLKFALRKLYEIEEQLFKEYALVKDSFEVEMENYNNLPPKERSLHSKPSEPVKKEIIVSDITFEAMIDVHANNPKGLCMYRDELRGVFNDLNKYRKGSDLEFLLSNWNSHPIKSNRKSDANSYFIKNPYIPIIGTIQKEILIETFRGEMMKNGLIDRFLFVFPESEVKPYFSDGVLPDDYIESYQNAINQLYNLRRENEEVVCRFSNEAFEVFKSWYNENADRMNNERSELVKGLYSKLETYVARFALLLELLSTVNNQTSGLTISLPSVEGAIKLADYFRQTSIYVREMMGNTSEEPNDAIMVKRLSKKGFSLRKIGEMMGLSHSQVGKLLKKS
ncbi:MAG: DUF3987 domain-containing protein [Bacteroidota bacterium]